MKEKILNAAAKLISQYGLKKFTIDEIASELRISKKTIYQYFNSKEDIIKEYFDVTINSDEENVRKELDSDKNFIEKIHAIIYASHQYRIPIHLLNELKLFYPDEWNRIEELKQFKLNTIKKLLEQAKDKNILKTDINFAVLTRMLDEISDMFLDYEFLLENKLKTREAIDEAFKIILQGVLKQSY